MMSSTLERNNKIFISPLKRKKYKPKYSISVKDDNVGVLEKQAALVLVGEVSEKQMIEESFIGEDQM